MSKIYERKIKNIKGRIEQLRSTAKLYKFTGPVVAYNEAIGEIKILQAEINEIEASKGGQSD